ncbi:MAG: hypothetical protein Q7T55_16660 [Solirubrobacteraceae bacterium]|nr:hypothetical protein [Solirubrobacteraceae bacterium]
MRHAFPLGAALGLFALAAAQPATAAPLSTPVPGITGPGDAIVRAADGSMWLTEPASPGRLARVSAQGTVIEYVGGSTPNLALDRSPEGFAITPDGFGWFMQRGTDDELGQIALDTGAVSTFLVRGGTPTSIAAGADGMLWIAGDGDAGEPDFVAKYDQVAKTTTSYTAGLAADSMPRALTAGSDGALWFAEGSPTGRLGRVATDGTITFRDIGGAASALGVGPSGGLWFGRGKQLGLFSETASSIFPATADVGAITTGPDGALWSATKGGVIRVVDGVASTIPAGLDPLTKGVGIASGADGRLWMTLDRAPYLVRITVPPYLGAVSATTGSPTTASVTSDVRANGLLTTVKLQSAGAGGTWTTLNSTVTGDGLSTAPVQFDVAGLPAGAQTALRVVASNAAGETIRTTSVSTAAMPTPVPTPQPTSTPKPTSSPKPTSTPKPTASPTPKATVGPTPGPATTPEAVTTSSPAPAASTPGATPAPTPVPDGPTAAPAPVQGSTVVVRLDRGTVTYKVPGSDTVRTVEGAASIPTGSTIDTTNGAVALSSRVEGKEQVGLFYGGQFKVKQVKATGLTQLYLNAPLDCAKPGAKAVRAAAAKKRKRRAVWGEDNKGRFETHGKDSVATVRGTKWLTTDTCGGTVVKVYEGAVSVKPTRGNGKAVLVKAGGRHVTRPVR